MPEPIPWTEVPDNLGLACLVTAVGIYRGWRAPAYLGLVGILCSNVCYEERALGNRHRAQSASFGAFTWSLIGIGVGIHYHISGYWCVQSLCLYEASEEFNMIFSVH